MEISSDFLTLLFKCTLFFLFSYKCYELVMRYLFPYLVQQKGELKKNEEELLEKEKLVSSTLRRVENQINHQRKIFILVEKKIQNWHRFMLNNHILEEKKQQLIITKIKEKRMLQQQQLSQKKLYKVLFPRIVLKAPRTLTTLPTRLLPTGTRKIDPVRFAISCSITTGVASSSTIET